MNTKKVTYYSIDWEKVKTLKDALKILNLLDIGVSLYAPIEETKFITIKKFLIEKGSNEIVVAQ